MMIMIYLATKELSDVFVQEKLRFQCDEALHGYQAREAEGCFSASIGYA